MCLRNTLILGVNQRADVFELLLERIIPLDLLLNLLARVNDRRVVAAAELLSD